MKLLITGATGFIGKHICKKIVSEKHEVIALSRSDISELKKDIAFNSINWIRSSLDLTRENLDQIRNFEPEVIIHLAWENIPDFCFETSFKNLKDHISFFHEILKISSVKKVIVAGSCWEYGKKQGLCMESEPCIPNNYFTWAKNSLREFLQMECLKKDIVLAWTRIFYVYGPGQRSGALIPTIISSLSSKTIPDIKTPKNANDLIYVEDIALAFDLLIKKKITSGIYNLGSGSSTSVLEVLRTAEKITHGDEKLTTLLLERTVNTNQEIDFWADMNTTIQTLNWKPLTSLEEGMKKMVKQLSLY